MTWNNWFDPMFAINLPNQDLLWERHYDILEEKGNYVTIHAIWEEIDNQTQRLEKELLLSECIHSYWEGKQKEKCTGEVNIEEIDECFNKILEILKNVVLQMARTEEIFTLEIYKIWRNNFEEITELFKTIHWLSGTALSYMLANNILDEVYYIANDEERLNEVEKVEERVFEKSFDILSLLGWFEKPLGTQTQIKERITRR